MKIQTIAIIGAAFLAWAWLGKKRNVPVNVRDMSNVVNYGGTIMSQEQAQMVAEQDAAFASSPDQYLVAPFHA